LDGVSHSSVGTSRTTQTSRMPRVAQVLKDCLDELKLTINSMEPVDADLALLLTILRGGG